jgi:hypothetical protein
MRWCHQDHCLHRRPGGDQEDTLLLEEKGDEKTNPPPENWVLLLLGLQTLMSKFNYLTQVAALDRRNRVAFASWPGQRGQRRKSG